MLLLLFLNELKIQIARNPFHSQETISFLSVHLHILSQSYLHLLCFSKMSQGRAVIRQRSDRIYMNTLPTSVSS